jgi:starch synthase (maltosyl-transferring)
MKPIEGRRRVIIEGVQPQVDAGRYPAKRTLGDSVTITAAMFSDGHDHVAGRLFYKHSSEQDWSTAPLEPLVNDLWAATFVADGIGLWSFTVTAWVDHFDTWLSDLRKRIAAQPDPHEPTQQLSTAQDIPLALRIGADHLEAAGDRAAGADAARLHAAAAALRSLAAENRPHYSGYPVSDEIAALAAAYPDLRYATRLDRDFELWVERERATFSAWYELFPRSASAVEGVHGTFNDVEKRLPAIAAMGFDIVYMPPIHPIGRAFRKGKNNSVTALDGDVGSPWAIGSAEGGHTALLPELGTLADFDSLVKAASAHKMEIALDIAFQCSPDHPWVQQHPDWFTIRPDGTIQYAENPPKKYQDIYPLNFEAADWRGLWDALYSVFQFWVDCGIRCFRVDNPHTKALPFWEWCLAEIRKTAPETIFLAEAFTRPHVMYSLAKGGYSQGYTYFTWRTKKWELEEYFTEINNPPVADFFRPNVWPNTPDILHEQFQVADLTLRHAIFSQRVLLAATLSANYGIYGPAYELLEGRAAPPAPGKTGSEEYLDSEKYQLRTWDLDAPYSLAPLLTQINAIRAANPALHSNRNFRFHTVPNENLIAYSKSTAPELPSDIAAANPGSPNLDTPKAKAALAAADEANTILTIVNLDPNATQSGMIDLWMPALNLPWHAAFEVEDLLTGERYQWSGQKNYVSLSPDRPAHILRIVR